MQAEKTDDIIIFAKRTILRDKSEEKYVGKVEERQFDNDIDVHSISTCYGKLLFIIERGEFE